MVAMRHEMSYHKIDMVETWLKALSSPNNESFLV